MSGVKVGTRLDQLLELEARIRQEIAQERRAVLTGTIDATPQPPAPRRLRVVRDETSTELLDHGLVSVPLRLVSPRMIRQWAREQGYALDIKGQLPSEVRAAFAKAHQ